MKTRNKLMTAVIMLVISAVMLSTASYAWFTISTNPEIKGLETQVVVNDNLEIALATNSKDVPVVPAADQSGKVQTSWGNIVDLSAAADTADGTFDFSDGNNGLDKTLRPIKLNDESGKATGFQYPQYGADGRITSFGNITEDITYQFGNLKDDKGNISGYYVDIWLRTNVTGTISITDTAADRGTGTNGAGSTIKTSATTPNDTATMMLADNIEIAFEILGTQTPKYSTDGAGTLTYEWAAGDEKITNLTKTYVAKNEYKLSGEVIKNAVANTAYLVRVYVYLDGTNVQNMGASITGNEISGAINLQFKHEKTLDAMDMPNTLPAAG